MTLQHVIDYKGGHHYFQPSDITDIYIQNPDDTEFYIVICKYRIIVMSGGLKEMKEFVEKSDKKLIKYCKNV